MFIDWSEEFEEAFEAEMKRFAKQVIKEYLASDEGYEEVDRRLEEEIKTMRSFLTFDWEPNHQPLRLHVYAENSDIGVDIDIEKAIDDEIAEGHREHLQYILDRLTLLASKVRDALPSPDAS